MLDSFGPLISICIPTYDRTKYLRGALDSCLKQNYPNFEVIVHDDTADDRIQSIIGSLSSGKIRYLHNRPPLGLVKKLNDFLDKAQGEWILILCDDDLLDPDYLKTLVPHIQKYPEATLVRSRYKLVDEKGDLIRLDRLNPFLMKPCELLSQIFLPENKSFKMNISGILFQKDLLKKLGGFKNLYRGWHVDRLAWAELSAEGSSICDPKPLSSVRLHSGAISGGTDPNFAEAIKTDLMLQTYVLKIIERAAPKAISKDEKKRLKKTKEALKNYTRRHLSRSIDQGFSSLLEQHKNHTLRAIRPLFRIMKDLKLPFFRSVYVYCFLAVMPYPVRMALLRKFRNYKMEKGTR